MNKTLTPGAKFRQALKAETPLQIMGTVNAYCAKMAEEIGFKAIYLSGGACAAMSYGLPDLGITSLDDVLEDVNRITDASSLPLLVDCDTGFGDLFNVERTVKQMIKAGAAAMHLEDQVQQKRCGHRPNKQLISQNDMVDKIKAAVNAKTNPDFFIMARTDAVSVEGINQAITRAKAYIAAGADGIFAEALGSLGEYKQFCDALSVPVLANITEFGKTPLFTKDELNTAGINMMLYPLTTVRAMNQTAEHIMKSIKEKGSQKIWVDHMQDRETLYQYLGYHAFEQRLDKFLDK